MEGEPADPPVWFTAGREPMQKKVWQAPKVQTTPVSMEVTMYLPAQA